ncbi:MAG: hypothetical protein IPK16_15455 [Anaerolineales bacterium]|nr:hypothetical protein [Anaerolineales bacterium]
MMTFLSMMLALSVTAFGVERILELIWVIVDWALGAGKAERAVRLRSAGYRQFKIGASILLGALAGVLLANLLNLRLFTAIDALAAGFAFEVPANWDIAITGILIGLLAKPIHDLVEVLAGLKDFFRAASIHQREAAASALADGVLKLAQADQQNVVDVPGIGPTRMMDTGFAPSPGETPPAEGASTTRYMDLLHERTIH